MIKRTAIFLFLAFFLFPGDAPAAESDEKVANSLLWEISGQGLESPSYLFGTIHQICPGDFVVFATFCHDEKMLFNPLDHKLSKTDKLVVEVDTEDIRYQGAMQRVLYLGEGESLRDFFTHEQFNHVRDFFVDSIGLDINTVSHVRPFFLVSMIYPHMLGCEPSGYEDYLIKRARSRGIDVAGIESVRFHVEMYENISRDQEVKELLNIIFNYEAARRGFEEMVRHYRRMDIESLRQASEGGKEDMVVDESFIVQRNLKWIPDMKELMHEQPVFFAFGASHLAGEYGLVNLLREEGYSVEPVIPPRVREDSD